MDKRNNRKSYRINGTKEMKIGLPLGIHDKFMNELHTGDKVKWGEYEGILLWDKESKSYWFLISYSQWYGEDIYNADSYGKGFELKMDNGARMEMEKIG